MSFGPDDLYAVLGINASASADDIKTAYRRAALRHHPDKGGSADAFKLVGQAFETLFCPNSRLRYDRRLDAKREKAEAKGRAAQRPTPQEQHQQQQKSNMPGERRCRSGFQPRTRTGRPKSKLSVAERLCRSMVRISGHMRAVKRDVRHTVLQSMSAALRQRLLSHMEQEQRSSRGDRQRSNGGDSAKPSQRLLALPPYIPPASDATGGSGQQDASKEEEDGEHAKARRMAGPDAGALGSFRCLVLQGADDQPSCTAEACPSSSSRPREHMGYDPGRQRPGIHFRRGKCKDFFVASVGIENFTIVATNVGTLEQAVNHHIALLQLKRHVQNEHAERPDVPFRCRMRDALVAVQLPNDVRPSYYTVMSSARNFGNKKLRTPATIDLEEALDQHTSMMQARKEGFNALAEAWKQAMQSARHVKKGARGNARKRPLSALEAEAVVSSALRAANARRAVMDAKRKERNRRNMRSQALRLLRRRRCPEGVKAMQRVKLLRNAVVLAEGQLETLRKETLVRKQLAEAAQKKRETKEALLQERLRKAAQRREEAEQKARSKVLKSWLRSRDLTFEQEREGPPLFA